MSATVTWQTICPLHTFVVCCGITAIGCMCHTFQDFASAAQFRIIFCGFADCGITATGCMCRISLTPCFICASVQEFERPALQVAGVDGRGGRHSARDGDGVPRGGRVRPLRRHWPHLPGRHGARRRRRAHAARHRHALLVDGISVKDLDIGFMLLLGTGLPVLSVLQPWLQHRRSCSALH